LLLLIRLLLLQLLLHTSTNLFTFANFNNILFAPDSLLGRFNEILLCWQLKKMFPNSRECDRTRWTTDAGDVPVIVFVQHLAPKVSGRGIKP
jgi:hypothetical protein